MVVTECHYHHVAVVVGDQRPEILREELHHVLAGEYSTTWCTAAKLGIDQS